MFSSNTKISKNTVGRLQSKVKRC